MKPFITTTWQPDYEDLLVMAGGRPICSVYPGWDHEEIETILRLVAKAPEMLSILQVAQMWS
jgi:hypothetical protein